MVNFDRLPFWLALLYCKRFVTHRFSKNHSFWILAFVNSNMCKVFFILLLSLGGCHLFQNNIVTDVELMYVNELFIHLVHLLNHNV